MIFDIRTKNNAKNFIKEFLDIDNAELNNILDNYYKDEEIFEKIYIIKIKSKEIDKIDLCGYHITTNSDNCESIKLKGIKNLQRVLEEKTELSQILLKYGIEFDIKNSIMYYNNEKIDINYKKMKQNRQYSENRNFRLARKIYYDYSVNGFLCSGEDYIKMTEIISYPEILKDIEECLGKRIIKLKDEWRKNCKAYKITFVIKIDQVNCEATFDVDLSDNVCNTEKSNLIKINMLKKAAEKILDNTETEKFIYLKDDAQIYNNQIINIETL